MFIQRLVTLRLLWRSPPPLLTHFVTPIQHCVIQYLWPVFHKIFNKLIVVALRNITQTQCVHSVSLHARVCVSGRVLTQALCYPVTLLSAYPPPVAADKGFPVASTSNAPQTHSQSVPQCVPVDSGVAVQPASSQWGPLCFTSGLDSCQTIWESVTGSTNEAIELGVYSYSVKLFLSFFSYVRCFIAFYSSVRLCKSMSLPVWNVVCHSSTLFVCCSINDQHFNRVSMGS